MEPVAPSGSKANGNTNIRLNAARHWCFTWNNYEEKDIEYLISKLAPISTYVFQEEIGEEEGTPHLQGHVSFNVKKRPLEVFNETKKIHWTKARNVKASIAYCFKEETRVGRSFTNMKAKRVHHKIEFEWKDWQKGLYESYKVDPDYRTVTWVVDYKGAGGKTTLAKWMIQNHEDVTVITATKSADILTMANEYSKLYIIDIPRCAGEFCPYNAIEQLKNGFITDCKLKKEGRVLMFEPPHVWVFSNHEPDRQKLSLDRFNIITLE